MFCEQCGAELEPDVRFCDRCGLQVRKEGSWASDAAVSRSGTERRLRLLQIGVGGAVLAVVVLGGALLWKGDPKNGGAVAVTGGSGGTIVPVPDGSLSREKAKEIIQPDTKSSPAEWYDGRDLQMYIALRYIERGLEGLYSELERGGYIEAIKHQNLKFRPTSKITPYLTQEPGHSLRVTLGKWEVQEITGITKPSDMFGHTIAQVEYTYMAKLNDLGFLFAESTSGEYREKIVSIKQGKKTLELYDDGWRLTK